MRITHALAQTCKSAAERNAMLPDFTRTFVAEVKRADVDYVWIVGIEGRRTMLVSEDDHSLDEADLRQAMFRMDTYMDTSAKHDTASYHVSVSPQDN
jgi:hypothetical protein